MAIGNVMLATLPPSMQSIAEIKTILQDPRFIEKIGPYAIDEIRRIEGGYLIFTKTNELKVEVHYLPQSSIGPQKFEIEIR